MFSLGQKLLAQLTQSSPDEAAKPSFGRSSNPTEMLTAMSEAVEGENKWKLTNIGGIGSEDDVDLRKKAAESEAEFDGAGSEPGLEIWRIEKFSPEKLSVRAGNLSLYSGDCYIILNTYEKEGSEQLAWDLHYWIGKDSTQDESGAAAYFSVNLDDLLNTKPVQHRELQHMESKLLHSYFSSLTYLDGGIDSGFKKVEPEIYKPRLLQMKTVGSNVNVVEVALSADSLNNGDVFILDNGLTVYQFNSVNAHFKERSRAMVIVQEDIKADRDGEPELLILDGDEVFECDAFWELLGGRVDELPDPDSVEEEEAAEPDLSSSKTLFKISNETGDLVLSMEKRDDVLSMDDINDDDVWVVAIDGACFIQIGASTNRDEKFYVWNNSAEILVAADLPMSAPVTYFSRDSDVALWEQLFS